MKKVLGYIIVNLLLLILGLPSISNGQINLVPNSSFEIYDTCPSVFNSLTYRSIYNAIPWFQPNINANSTDYFNSCNLDTIQSLDVPLNYEGYQLPRIGVGYAGFSGGYISPQNNAREYLEVQLTDSLISGKKYCISFYVSFSNKSATAIDGIGAYLSKIITIDNAPSPSLIVYQPQIENLAGNIITDTVNWVNIYGEFYATGGEKFITIGNFKDDAHTAYIRNIVGASHLYSYYYIDDVSVIYCDSDVGISENEWIKNFTISPNPAQNIISLNNLPKSVSDIFIYDLQGKIIYREKNISILQNKHEIIISNLSSGVYLVKVVTEGGVVARKFVKN